MNNALLDTYQLKSLDGVTEVPVEKLTIRRRDDKYYVYMYDDGRELEHSDSSNISASDVSDDHSLTAGARLVDDDNFALREPYDRIIRCLGFKFNESLFSQ